MGDIFKRYQKTTVGILLIMVLLPVFQILELLDLLGGVWSTFSSTPLFQQLPEWGPAMITALPWWLELFLNLGILGFVVWVFVALQRWKKEYHEIEALADEDSAQMTKRILVIEESKKAFLHLNPIGPHVILRVKIVNSSVYRLTLEENIDGRVTYWSWTDHLPQEPEIYRTQNLNQPITIAHGEVYQLEIRQFLPPHVAAQCEQIITPTEFGVPRAALWFVYQDRTGVTQRVRIRLGLPFFTQGHLAVSARP